MISYVGSATGSNTVTLPAHQTGDLFVAFAFRDGSSTAPTNASDWTSVSTPSIALSCSARVSYKIAASGSEGNPTFTNATSVVVHVYRDAIYSSVTTDTGISTTVTYPAMTVSGSDNWYVGFAGHKNTDTSLETAPSGMTNRSTVNDATDEAAGHDTNGPTSSSYSATGVSVGGTYGGWIAATVRLLQPSTRYWVGGTGTWDGSDTSHWAYNTGGSGGASVPTSSNAVFFDSNSGTGTATLGADANASSIDMSSYGGTITTANYSVTIPAGGSWVNNGTGANTLNLGSSAVNTGSWNFQNANSTLNAGTSTIKITSTGAGLFIYCNGHTYYNFDIEKNGGGTASSCVIEGNNTFYNLYSSSDDVSDIFFALGSTNTFSNFNINGLNKDGNEIGIKRAISGSGADPILVYNGTKYVDVNELAISNTVASPANKWYANTTSTDGTGNTGWIFGRPKTELVVDDFNDNSINTEYWASYGSISETGSQIQVSLTGASPNYSGLYTVDEYNLTGSTAMVELKNAGNQAWTSLEVELQLLASSSVDNRIFFLITNGSIAAYKTVATVTTSLASATYNSTTHRWLRFREASGTTYWEYSSDATTWSTLHSAANPITVTSMEMQIDAGIWAAESGTSTVIFDNFNNIPTTSTNTSGFFGFM